MCTICLMIDYAPNLINIGCISKELSTAQGDRLNRLKIGVFYRLCICLKIGTQPQNKGFLVDTKAVRPLYPIIT